jgi:putative endonuclease
MGRNQILGAKGEELVAEYLKAQGYRIIDRNWRIKEGEIDLIATNKRGRITFIEVKTRRNENFGHPLEAISKDKAYRLQKLALAWLVLNNVFGSDYGIDCASVLMKDGKTEIDYREGVL